MNFSDELFDVLLILLYLATPLAWAATMFFQEKNWAIQWHRPATEWNTPKRTAVVTAPPVDKS